MPELTTGFFEVIDPISYPKWNETLMNNEQYSFFYTSNWANVLFKTYKYKPMYLTVFDDDKLRTLFPLMSVKSVLTGNRGVSLPFSDYCEPLIADDMKNEEIQAQVISFGKENGWNSVELRGGTNDFQKFAPVSKYYSHHLDISQDYNKLYSYFKKSVQRNIKKANRSGVEIKIDNSNDSLIEFYRLHSLTRKKHGVPLQPFSFFKNIQKYILSQNLGTVILAKHEGRSIAGAIFFHIGNKVLYKFGASNKKYLHLRPNNLVFSEAIRWFSERKYRTLCLGRTDLDNEGLRQFKKSWGAEEKKITYFRYNFNENATSKNHSSLTHFQEKILTKVPIFLLKFLGFSLYKHMG